MLSNDCEPYNSDHQTSRRLVLRHTLLTFGVFIPLLAAFITDIEWYPVSQYKMFYGTAALNKGHECRYFIFRGETAAGDIVDIAPITIMDGMDDRIWTMVDSVVSNESLQIKWPHPRNEKLIAVAGSSDNLPRAALLSELLRCWGNRYNAKLSHDSPKRLVRVRLDAYRWPEREYANYSEFVESWRVDL